MVGKASVSQLKDEDIAGTDVAVTMMVGCRLMLYVGVVLAVVKRTSGLVSSVLTETVDVAFTVRSRAEVFRNKSQSTSVMRLENRQRCYSKIWSF